MLQYLQEAKKKSAEKNALRIEKQKGNLFKNKFNAEKQKNQQLQYNFDNYKIKSEKESVNDGIIGDLIAHSNSDSKKKPFSEEILELSSKIHSISPSAYQCLAEKLPFPSESYIQEMNHKITSNISALFQNVDKIPEIVDIWKSKSGINKSLTIYACLSVDALFFTPNIQINENSIFEGIVLDEKDELFVSKNIFTNFLNNPNDFQTFLRLNNDKIIRAGFVFQVQPYNPIYSTFIVHIKPASNGKANITIVNLLKKIKTILKNKI